MATTGRTVYVLSVIPRLAKHVQEKLPDVNVIEVLHKGMASVFDSIERLSLFNNSFTALVGTPEHALLPQFSGT